MVELASRESCEDTAQEATINIMLNKVRFDDAESFSITAISHFE